MKSRSIVQEYPKVWISLIVTVLVTTVLMMASQITGGPTISYGYHGAGSAPQITASASERIAGKSDAKYSVDFTPDVTAPAQEITIQFPDGFTVASNPTVTSGRIGNGQAGSIQVQGGINYTPTISVTGQVVTLALPAPLDLTIAEGVQFQFTTGITNPTAIGLTGTFAVDSDASGQVSDNSLGVTIVHDAASQLGFGTEPVGGNRQTGQSTIGTQPVVQILDQFGNLVTTDPSGGSTESVTIAFQSGTNTEGSALSGTTSVNVSWPAGTATFTDLATDTVGTYNFTATDTNFSPNLTDVNSAAFSTNAATWYALASTGSDSNACLSTGVGNACLTIGGAMGKATIKGDTISAAAGTYAETVNITKPLTVQGAGITSIIQPSSGNAVEIRVSNITVDNLKIVGSSNGFGVTLIGNVTHDSITISNNTISSASSSSAIGACGTESSCLATTNLSVTGNTITTSSTGPGLSTAAYSTAVHTGWTVSNNTFTPSSSAVNVQLYDIHNLTMSNNTFGATTNRNVVIGSEAVNLTGATVISNNTFSGNTNSNMVEITDDLIGGSATDTTMANISLTGNSLDGWGAAGLSLGGGVSSVTLSTNGFLKTGSSVVAVTNASASSVTATDNFWGKASGPGGTGAGEGGNIVTSGGAVSYRPWQLSQGTVTFDETIALTSGGSWTLLSAPQLLSAAPTITDDSAGAVTVLAHVNGAFVGPGDAFNTDVVNAVSAFFVNATNTGAVGFDYTSPTAPGLTSKTLTSGWNLVGSNTNGAEAKDEFSSIQNTSVTAGLLTLYAPDTFNDSARKDKGHIDWSTDGDRDLNADPITSLPTKTVSEYDGYWVFMNAARNWIKLLD